MASELNFFDTYVLMAITEEIVPQQTFFKDRYFPTGEGDIFACDKVLTCLLYTSDAADEEDSVDLGGRRIIKKSFLQA